MIEKRDVNWYNNGNPQILWFRNPKYLKNFKISDWGENNQIGSKVTKTHKTDKPLELGFIRFD